MLKRAFYRFAVIACTSVFKIFWRLEIRGLENIPKTGGVIVAANHRSYTDPPLVGISVPREVHFLAKKELFDFKPFGWIISALNAHPLDRAGDIGAFKLGLKLLEEGYVMIVFPEGRRQKSDVLGKAKAGVGFLSSASGCPVIPTFIQNSGYLARFRKIRVLFGPPLVPKKGESNEDLTENVMKEIQNLQNSSLG